MSQTILIADDSRTVRTIVKMAFKASGYDVAEQGEGAKVIATVQERRPDVLILDYFFPDGDGYEICRALKENPATMDVPILMIGGKFKQFNEGLARTSGADAILVKPFKTDALLSAVEEARTKAAENAKKRGPVQPKAAPAGPAAPVGQGRFGVNAPPAAPNRFGAPNPQAAKPDAAPGFGVNAAAPNAAPPFTATGSSAAAFGGPQPAHPNSFAPAPQQAEPNRFPGMASQASHAALKSPGGYAAVGANARGQFATGNHQGVQAPAPEPMHAAPQHAEEDAPKQHAQPAAQQTQHAPPEGGLSAEFVREIVREEIAAFVKDELPTLVQNVLGGPIQRKLLYKMIARADERYDEVVRGAVHNQVIIEIEKLLNETN